MTTYKVLYPYHKVGGKMLTRGMTFETDMDLETIHSDFAKRFERVSGKAEVKATEKSGNAPKLRMTNVTDKFEVCKEFLVTVKKNKLGEYFVFDNESPKEALHETALMEQEVDGFIRGLAEEEPPQD